MKYEYTNKFLGKINGWLYLLQIHTNIGQLIKNIYKKI